jgi:hypothetical protein
MKALVAAALVFAGTAPAAAQDAAVVPGYYAEAFKLSGIPLIPQQSDTANGVQRRAYATASRGASLFLQRVPCEGPACTTFVDNAVGRLNAAMSEKGGAFVAVSLENVAAKLKQGATGEQWVFVYRLPRAVLFWEYVIQSSPSGFEARRQMLDALTDRQRFEDAAALDNVEIGRWPAQITAYAKRLFDAGDKTQALKVWRTLLASAPNAYAAQLDFAEATPDAAAARNAAMAVYDNAEDAPLIARAAAKLGLASPDLARTAELSKGENGLQLILVPLPPVDLRVVQEAAKVYEKITGVPTKIRRLAEEIPFGEPDRIPNERWARETIMRLQKAKIDFTGWSKERYASELLKGAEGADALSRFFVSDFIEKLETWPGQYQAEPYLRRFLDVVAGYRSDDARTMYVGVTGANIYGGQANYVFSSYTAGKARGSLLSYAMMEAKTLNDPRPSRKRLTERLAKEMVPASLKSLDIPRPADPSDPYSYADSVDRLDQKTLELSPPTKEALDRFRR